VAWAKAGTSSPPPSLTGRATSGSHPRNFVLDTTAPSGAITYVDATTPAHEAGPLRVLRVNVDGCYEKNRKKPSIKNIRVNCFDIRA